MTAISRRPGTVQALEVFSEAAQASTTCGETGGFLMPSPGEAAAMIEAAAVCLAQAGHHAVARALLLCLEGRTFERTLGISPRWLAKAKVQVRDAALMALAARYPRLTGRPLAREVARTIDRYRASASFPGNRLDLLLVLVSAYEDEHFAMDPPDPIDAIVER